MPQDRRRRQESRRDTCGRDPIAGIRAPSDTKGLLTACGPRQPLAVQAEAVETLAALQRSRRAGDLDPRLREMTPRLRQQQPRPSSPARMGRRVPGRGREGHDRTCRCRAGPARTAQVLPRRRIRPALYASSPPPRPGDKMWWPPTRRRSVEGRPGPRSRHLQGPVLILPPPRRAGQQVGADLSAIRDRGLEAVLLNILDPNREVMPQFLSYVLVTTSGRVLTGMITVETTNSLTIRQPDGHEETVLRLQIDELRSTGLLHARGTQEANRRPGHGRSAGVSEFREVILGECTHHRKLDIRMYDSYRVVTLQNILIGPDHLGRDPGLLRVVGPEGRGIPRSHP